MTHLQTRFQFYLLIVAALILTGCTADWLTVTGQVIAAKAQVGQVRGDMTKMNIDNQALMSDTLDGFISFQSRAHRLALQYPEGWSLETDTDAGRFVVLLSHDPTVFAGKPDFQKPFTFLIAGIRLLEEGEDQTTPLVFQNEFLADFELDMEPLSELEVIEGQGSIQVSQDFYATDNDQAELEITITTVIKNQRTITFLYGGNEVGLDQHGEALKAVADTIDLIDVAQLTVDESTVDFSDPVSVVDAIFLAAVTEDYEVLSGLCDPLQENDEDTAVICEIHAEHQYIQEFADYFQAGQIMGDATIVGDEAEVPFMFGPDGDEEETMILIKRDGKWYLSSF